MLNLRHPGNAHAHGGSGLLLAQTQLLAGLSELVPARLGEQPARTRLDFLGRDPAAFNSRSSILPVQGVRDRLLAASTGVLAGQRGGGCEIRTREGLPPTRFPNVRLSVHAMPWPSVSCGRS